VQCVGGMFFRIARLGGGSRVFIGGLENTDAVFYPIMMMLIIIIVGNSNSRVISATASSDSRLFLLVEMPKQLFVPSVSVGKRDAQNIYIYIYIYVCVCVCVCVYVCGCVFSRMFCIGDIMTSEKYFCVSSAGVSR